MSYEGRSREDSGNGNWPNHRPYFRHGESDLPPMPPDNNRLPPHHLSQPTHYQNSYRDTQEPHRQPSILGAPGRLPPLSPSAHGPLRDRRPSGSAPSWDRPRPPSPPLSGGGPYSRHEPLLPRMSGHYAPTRGAWDDPRTPNDLPPSSGRESLSSYRPPPPPDFRDPLSSHSRHAHPLPPHAREPMLSPSRSSHLPPVNTWTPNDAPWPDPRDRRTPLPSPVSAEWDRRKTSSWMNDRTSDIGPPGPHHISRTWDEPRELPPQRIPPEPVADLQWRREQDQYPAYSSRTLPEIAGTFRPSSSASSHPIRPRNYDRPFDSVGGSSSYASPASLPPVHSYHDRVSSGPMHRHGHGPQPISAIDPSLRRSHGRSTSGSISVDEGFAPEPRRIQEIREIREIKREPTDEPGEWKPSISKHSTGSSAHGGSFPSIMPSYAVSRTMSNEYTNSSPRDVPPISAPAMYQLPPIQHPHNLPQTDAMRASTPMAPYGSARRSSSRSADPSFRAPSASVGTYRPPSPDRRPPSSTPMPAWQDSSFSRPRREFSRPVDIARPEPLAPAPMDIDAAPRRASPPPEHHDVHMANGEPSREDLVVAMRPPPSEDEDVTRPASEEESPSKPTRRISKRRIASTRGRRGYAENDGMDVDQDTITPPSGQTSPPRSAVLQYLRENQRFGLDADLDLVEDVINQNRKLNDTPSSRLRSDADELVDEVAMSSETGHLLQLYGSGTRDLLIERIALGSAEVTDKAQRLKEQYRQLNKHWLANCAELDRQVATEKELKTPIPATPIIEMPTPGAAPSFTSGRATRRNAGNLSMADAVRSDLEFEQVMQSLGNEDLVDPNVLSIRNAATIPDMLSVLPRSTPMLEVVYDDSNGLVVHPEQFYDISVSLGDWSEGEKGIFMEQFAIFGKQFGKIAEHLEHKTAEQCVLYYYISKKLVINFREVASKGVRGRRKRMAKRSGGAVPGKQKGNALLTDIRTRMGDSTPMESPNGSPKQLEMELPSRRRRGADYGTPSLGEDMGRTRITRSARQRRGMASPDSSGETPARESADDGSSSNSETDAGEAAARRRPEPRRTRKPTQAADGTTNAPPVIKRKSRASSHWSTAEKATFKEHLAIHGKNYEAIASAVRTKSATQCRNFYVSNETDLELWKIVQTYEARQKAAAADNDGPSRDSKEDLIHRAEAPVTSEASNGLTNGVHSMPQIENGSTNGRTSESASRPSAFASWSQMQPNKYGPPADSAQAPTTGSDYAPYTNGGSHRNGPGDSFVPYNPNEQATKSTSSGGTAHPVPPMHSSYSNTTNGNTNGNTGPYTPGHYPPQHHQQYGHHARPGAEGGPSPPRTARNGSNTSPTSNRSYGPAFPPPIQDFGPYGSKPMSTSHPPSPLQALPPFGSKPNPLHVRRASNS